MIQNLGRNLDSSNPASTKHTFWRIVNPNFVILQIKDDMGQEINSYDKPAPGLKFDILKRLELLLRRYSTFCNVV